MKELRERSGVSPRALEFAILTAARSGEIRGAEWSRSILKVKHGPSRQSNESNEESIEFRCLMLLLPC